MSPLWIVLTLLPVLGGAERFNCKGRILGAYYADAKSGCKAFHVCVRVAGGGIRDFRFFCPPGTLFHQEAQTCTDWGDDDPLACPADLYDGQFDLYKLGSVYDTKKVSSSGNREEEVEFGLQRAETGDHRLSQNNVNSNAGISDLRTAHSSDFFSGQRERGRDENSLPSKPQSTSPPSSLTRQSFRRGSTTRATPTQYTPTVPTTQPDKTPPYEVSSSSKRKLVRKRPIYASTPLPSTYAQNVSPSKSPTPVPQQKVNRRILPQNKVTLAPVNIPAHFQNFKDEYVEVSRVTPKPTRLLSNKAYSAPVLETTPSPYFKKKESLIELYNYEAQTTPGLNIRNENQQTFNVRNNFNVLPDVPKEPKLSRENVEVNSNGGRDASNTIEYNTISSRGFASNTPTYRNLNSVSYEPEKNRGAPFSGKKQNYFNGPSTSPPTAIYTTRPEPPLNLNTVAYNTNIGIGAQASNYAESEEDDGQYRPPPEEDDGQYRPEQYERELLTGAHSLNIAASGNRLPDDQKPRKQQSPKVIPQTAPPRPFRPSPTPSAKETYPTTTSSQTVESRTFDYFQTYTTTSRPSDIPVAYQSENIDDGSRGPLRPTTTPPSRAPETRSPNRSPPFPRGPPAPTTSAPTRPPTRPTNPSTSPKTPHYAKPANNKEDASYDYAYYDTDPGFSEYDNIEEFGKTKTKKA